MSRLSPRISAAIVVAAWSACASDLRAQCPDGSTPPCQAPRVATRVPSRPPDPNRIAILPFRVATADTLLGEGFAELLSTEFTGEGVPRAIDMATVLSAWRRAGGGLRTPLTRARAVQVARDLGAGLVSEGSIVGLGRQITITTTLLTVPDGAPRGTAARVTASSDSLDAALRQAATGLLAVVGGQQRAIEGARFTDSPEAMRSYLAGLSAWRRGRPQEAVDAFDRAIGADSSFAQALFRRNMAVTWGFPGRRPYDRLAWEQRAKLAPRERAVLEAVLGASYPRPRTANEVFGDRERAAVLLPDSPDALYFLGDFWYHYGGRIDAANQLTRARDFLERAAAIDSQATVLRHLIEVGLRLRDTSLLRRVAPAFARTEAGGRWEAAWLVAASTRDNPQLSALRRRLDQSSEPLVPSPSLAVAAAAAAIPASLLDEMFARVTAAIPTGQRRNMQFTQGAGLAARGRPAAAELVWLQVQDNAFELELDRLRVEFALMGMADGLDVAGSLTRLAKKTPGDSSGAAQRECTLALWRVRGDTATPDLERFWRLAPLCARTIELVRLPADGGTAALARLADADSVLRNTLVLGLPRYASFFLARAWETAGDPRRALTAIRYHGLGGFTSEALWTLPEEGRLAALAGDTTGAVRAYRSYMEITADAEPILTPKRDSIRAELVRLSRRP